MFPTAGALAQTTYSSAGHEASLTKMTASEAVRYKYGLRKQNDGSERVSIPATARSTCDLGIGSNIEHAWLYGKSQAIFIYTVNAKDLVYDHFGGKVRTHFWIFVRVRDAAKTIDRGFEDIVTDATELEILAKNPHRKIVYRKIVDLPPGSYRADVTVRNPGICRDPSSKAFTLMPFTVPARGIVIDRDPHTGISPFYSTLVLGRPLELFNRDPAVFDAPWTHWIMPDATGDFHQGETIAVWYSLHIPIFPECTTAACPINPDDVEYIVESTDGKVVMRFAQDWKEHRVDTTGRVTTTFNTDSMTPGKYRITASVKQRSSGMTFVQSDVFRILKPVQ